MARAAGHLSSARPRPRRSARASAAGSDHQIKQRAHILSHAAKAFAEHGYAATTMDMLSEVTRMNKASLYYYFDSKQDILFELSRKATQDGYQLSLPAVKMKTGRDGVIHLIETGIRNLYSHLYESRIFQQEFPYFRNILSDEQYRELMELQRNYMKVVYQVLEQGVQSGEFRKLNVRLVGGLFASWMNSSLRFQPTSSQDEITQSLIDLFLPGLLALPKLTVSA